MPVVVVVRARSREKRACYPRRYSDVDRLFRRCVVHVAASAREAQGLLELKIAQLQNLVVNAKVVDASLVGTDKVQMLNKVKVQNLGNGRIMEFTIVGESEADFANGRLAATTPIAKALIGHGLGEEVEAHAPSGVLKFKILEISL